MGQLPKNRNIQEFRRIAASYKPLIMRHLEISRQIELTEHCLLGVSSVDTSKERCSGAGHDPGRIFDLYERKDALIRESEIIKAQLKWIRDIIGRCDLEYRAYIWRIYVRRDISLTKLARRLEIPWETLSRKITATLSEAVTDEELKRYEAISGGDTDA